MRSRWLLYIGILAMALGVAMVLGARRFPARRRMLEQWGAIIFIGSLVLWGLGIRLAD
jgi:drug/metabolite transporter (DMT)-like permease